MINNQYHVEERQSKEIDFSSLFQNWVKLPEDDIEQDLFGFYTYK